MDFCGCCCQLLTQDTYLLHHPSSFYPPIPSPLCSPRKSYELLPLALPSSTVRARVGGDTGQEAPQGHHRGPYLHSLHRKGADRSGPHTICRLPRWDHGYSRRNGHSLASWISVGEASCSGQREGSVKPSQPRPPHRCASSTFPCILDNPHSEHSLPSRRAGLSFPTNEPTHRNSENRRCQQMYLFSLEATQWWGAWDLEPVWIEIPDPPLPGSVTSDKCFYLSKPRFPHL